MYHHDFHQYMRESSLPKAEQVAGMQPISDQEVESWFHFGSPNKIWLAIPQSEYRAAKAAGARASRGCTDLYIPQMTPLKRFVKWLDQGTLNRFTLAGLL